MSRKNAQPVARNLITTLSGLLALGLAAASAASAFGQTSGTWTKNDSPFKVGRTFYSATLLQNGQVLAAGGFDAYYPLIVGSAWLFNASTDTWTKTGAMARAAYHHTATLLANGQVLVAGGIADPETGVIAQLYNPSTGSWSGTGSMSVPRFEGHSAVLLPNGNVLIAGGYTKTTGSITNTAEIYHPSTGTFAATGSMNEARASAGMTLLPNGEVLIVGGDAEAGSCTAELFSNGEWRLAANPLQCGAGTVLLPNGKVLVVGTNNASDVYNPSTNVWQATLNGPNVSGGLALLDTGNVLIAGGALVSGGSNAALYDPSTNEWTPTASSPLDAQTLTRLLHGQALATELGRETALYTP
jgi:hypothetical protein